MINTCISPNLSHWDRNKPRVVQADLRLLEMQRARTGAALGSVEMSQGKASVPVAASGHGPGGALPLWRLFGLNRRQICSKEGRGQRSGRSQPCSDLFGPLCFRGTSLASGCCTSQGSCQRLQQKRCEMDFLQPLQSKIWQRTRCLLWIATNPLGSLLCSYCTDFQKKKGKRYKKMERKLPARLLPCSWRRLGVLSWQGKTPALSTGCILTACELQAMSPSLPQTAKPFRARPGFWFLYGSTAGSLPTQKLLALHTAPTDGDPWSQGQAPGRCTVALHSSTRHEEGSSSIGRVPRDGGSILHKLGQSSCSCVSRDKTRLSVPKASPKHLGSPGCHCGRQARAAATHLSQQQAGHRDFVEFTPPRSAFDTQHCPAS